MYVKWKFLLQCSSHGKCLRQIRSSNILLSWIALNIEGNVGFRLKISLTLMCAFCWNISKTFPIMSIQTVKDSMGFGFLYIKALQARKMYLTSLWFSLITRPHSYNYNFRLRDKINYWLSRHLFVRTSLRVLFIVRKGKTVALIIRFDTFIVLIDLFYLQCLMRSSCIEYETYYNETHRIG